jgi:hypothetical protein
MQKRTTQKDDTPRVKRIIFVKRACYYGRPLRMWNPHTGKMLEAVSRTRTPLSYWPTAWNILCGQETWDDFIH